MGTINILWQFWAAHEKLQGSKFTSTWDGKKLSNRFNYKSEDFFFLLAYKLSWIPPLKMEGWDLKLS